MTIILLLASVGLAKEGAGLVLSRKVNQQENNNVIVIDGGHGGIDPGKIGINGAKEAEINLQIALRLKALLEAQGFKVVMTRENGDGLYSPNSTNKKVEDMRKRCEMITDVMPIFTVSIHQNSYPQEHIKGAQVFYYGKSAEGKDLANFIQASMVERLDPKNHRQAKANESYYLLKKTPTPTVIVECGFLSNEQEEKLLITQDYQEQVAWAVHMGIIKYLNQ